MKNLINLPNIISFTRLPLAVLTIIYFNSNLKYLFFIIAAMTDWLDGFLARILKQESLLGSKVDPFFDKVYLISVFAFVFINLKLPFYYLIFFFARDIFSMIGVIFVYFSGLIKKIDIKSRFLGKVVTVMQFMIILYLFFGFTSFIGAFMIILFCTSIICIADYSYYFAKSKPQHI